MFFDKPVTEIKNKTNIFNFFNKLLFLATMEFILHNTFLFSEMLKSVHLFSLFYGTEPQNIGLKLVPLPTTGKMLEGEEIYENSLGPTDFTIGFDGSIYIADTVNEKIKKFSMKGELLFISSAKLAGLKNICVDSKGNILVVQQLNNKLKFLLLTIKDGKEEINEILLPDELKEDTSISECFSTSKGFIFICNPKYYYRIGPDFKNIEKFESAGYYCSPYLLSHDLYYSYKFEKSGTKELIRIFHIDGKKTEILLDIFRPLFISIRKETGEELKRVTIFSKDFEEEKRYPLDLHIVKTDERGHFYILKQPLEIRWISLRKDKLFGVLQSTAILEYDRDGKFVEVRAIFNEFGPSFKLDPEGNVYYLDFKSDRVDVMMAPAPETDSKLKKRGDGKK